MIKTYIKGKSESFEIKNFGVTLTYDLTAIYNYSDYIYRERLHIRVAPKFIPHKSYSCFFASENREKTLHCVA